MRYFFENPLRFSREFEDVYTILGDYGRNDNPRNVARVFDHLRDYHRANQQDPDSPRTVPQYSVNKWTGHLQSTDVPVPGGGTWGEMVEGYREGLASLVSLRRLNPDKEAMDPRQAWAIADRLIADIPAKRFLRLKGPAFVYHVPYERELKAGDPILITSPGEIEAYREWLNE